MNNAVHIGFRTEQFLIFPHISLFSVEYSQQQEDISSTEKMKTSFITMKRTNMEVLAISQE